MAIRTAAAIRPCWIAYSELKWITAASMTSIGMRPMS
jgi:hypothetical protein